MSRFIFALAVALVFFTLSPICDQSWILANNNPKLLNIANTIQDSNQANIKQESVDGANEDLEKIHGIKQRLEESRDNQDSTSLISMIFSSPWGVAGVILLFFVIFALVYFTLKSHHASNGG